MIINRSGITIRMSLAEMRVLGRATQGVRLIELRDKDKIAAVAKVDSELHEDEGTNGAGGVVPGPVTDDPSAPEAGNEDAPGEEPANGTDVAEGGTGEE